MKNFQDAIKKYLDNRAATDELFAAAYAKEDKSIKQCCDYIIGEIRAKAKSQAVAVSDEEVYGLAVHYYDEDNIRVRKAEPCTVNTGELSEADKKQLREQAEKEYKAKCIADFKMAEIERRSKLKTKRKKEEELFVGSLF